MRCCRRSCSNTSASPTITRAMPGFFSANCTSSITTRAAWRVPAVGSWASAAVSRSTIWLMSENTDCSMKSISPSNICALLAKWRYKAASLTSRRAARAAVVMRSAPGCSNMAASACNTCTRRSPGLGRLRTVGAVEDIEVAEEEEAAASDMENSPEVRASARQCERIMVPKA